MSLILNVSFIIADISEAQFRRNETKFFWKSSFADQDYKESELKFRKQYKHRVPCPREGEARGINAAKKEQIVWDFG